MEAILTQGTRYKINPTNRVLTIQSVVDGLVIMRADDGTLRHVEMADFQACLNDGDLILASPTGLRDTLAAQNAAALARLTEHERAELVTA